MRATIKTTSGMAGGACYYRSGEPCYIGGWKENRREGLGATFQNGTHALHVGKWKDGVPGKMATLFDGEGNLRFAGQLENGQRQGVGVSYRADDGALFVGKWKDNRPTGEGTEFDAQGQSGVHRYVEGRQAPRPGHGIRRPGQRGLYRGMAGRLLL